MSALITAIELLFLFSLSSSFTTSLTTFININEARALSTASSSYDDDHSSTSALLFFEKVLTLMKDVTTERTDYDRYDVYEKLINDDDVISDDDSIDDDDYYINYFVDRDDAMPKIDLRLSIAIKLSGFKGDGNLAIDLRKRSIEPFLKALNSDVIVGNNLYKMHFHYTVLHAKKDVNADIERTIERNLEVTREWRSNNSYHQARKEAKAKTVVDFSKIEDVLEKDIVFGGDDDDERKTDLVVSPYVIYVLSPRRPKNPNLDNIRNVEYIYAFDRNKNNDMNNNNNNNNNNNMSQCFGTSRVTRARTEEEIDYPSYAWIDLTSGPNGFTKKTNKYTNDFSRRVAPKVLAAHKSEENLPLLCASIAGFLGDASKSLFAPSIHRAFLNEHDLLEKKHRKRFPRDVFKTDDAWVSHVQVEIIRISELPFNLQSDHDEKKIDPLQKIEKYLEKSLLPGRKIKVNERNVDFKDCPLIVQAFKNAMHYSSGSNSRSGVRRTRTSKSSGIDYEKENEFLLDENELIHWIKEYADGIRKQLRLRESDEKTKVLPVFLFDLKLTTHGKHGAFTDGKQSEISDDNSFIVAVRNSKKHKIEIPSFKCFEDDPSQNAWVDSSDVLRSLKASLTTSLFGIYIDLNRDDVDFSWSIGNDIFTPLSNADGDSFAIIDSAKRTTITVGLQKIRLFVAERFRALEKTIGHDTEETFALLLKKSTAASSSASSSLFANEKTKKEFIARLKLLRFKHDEAIKQCMLREWERAASFALSSVIDANKIVSIVDEIILKQKVSLNCFDSSSSTRSSSSGSGSGSSITKSQSIENDKKKKKQKKNYSINENHLILFFEALFVVGSDAFFGTFILIVSYVGLVEIIARVRNKRALHHGQTYSMAERKRD